MKNECQLPMVNVPSIMGLSENRSSLFQPLVSHSVPRESGDFGELRGFFWGFSPIFRHRYEQKNHLCPTTRTCHAGKFWKAVLPLMATITAPDSEKSRHSPLVGAWATPLKNMKVNWDDYSQYMGK